MIKLNLGCGIVHQRGFINIDKYVTKEMVQQSIDLGVRFARIDEGSEYLQEDVTNLPFLDNSIDYIESIDVIEHFGFVEVDKFIGEIKRVLKPGCMARIQTVDFNGLAQEWVDEIANKELEPDGQTYMNLAVAIYGHQHGEGQLHKVPWTPVYANYKFITEFKFSGLNVIVHPKGVSAITIMEVGLQLSDQKPGENFVMKHQALIFEVTK